MQAVRDRTNVQVSSLTIGLLIPIMVITITAERHLHAASIPDGALLAELTFGAEVRDGGEDSRATDTCSLLSARGYLSTV
ncbi:hypothetical protein NQZ68_028850 [Dissostichus eleginoides]|nr:hypothetical protein NQZ68_028850 [Dissostichus eleginoides]